MKRLLLVMLVVAVLVCLCGLPALGWGAAEPPMTDSCVCPDQAGAILGEAFFDVGPPASFAAPTVAAWYAMPAITPAATMEQSTPHTNCDLADALQSHVNLRTYQHGRNLDAVKSAPVNVRDHAPL